MRVRRSAALFSCLFIVLFQVISFSAIACGHDGFYMGFGYTQLFMYTTENRMSGGNADRITFGPGYGANALFGYDFCGSRWGVQMPFEFDRLKINKSEYVNQLGSSVEGVLHLVQWENGLDIHLVGGAGWMHITEGLNNNNSAATGITGSFGPGLSYYFSKQENVTLALAAEVPVRVIHYFGSHLSTNGTTILAVPIRLSFEVGF